MFVLSETEIETVVSQNVIPHKKYLGGITFCIYATRGCDVTGCIEQFKRYYN